MPGIRKSTAWSRTLTAVSQALRDMGHEICVISPDQFTNFPCPTYPEIRLALATSRTVGAMLEEFAPDAITPVDRGAALSGRAALVHPPKPRLHHRLPHHVSRLCRAPHRGFARMDMAADAPLPRPLGPGDGGDRQHRRAVDRTWHRSSGTLGPRRRSGSLFAGRAAARALRRSAAPDPALCRPGRGGEECRGVPWRPM